MNGSPAKASTPLAIDFIVRLERLHDDMHAFVAEINRRRDPTLPPYPCTLGQEHDMRNISHMQTMYSHVVDFPYTVEEAYSGPNSGCLQHIARNFRSDFEVLGFALPSR